MISYIDIFEESLLGFLLWSYKYFNNSSNKHNISNKHGIISYKNKEK